MRTKSLMMVAAVLLMAAGARAQDQSAAADQPKPVTTTTAPTPTEFVPVNQVDIGFRATAFGDNSDKSRYVRYQDMRDGGTLDRFRFFKDTNAYGINLQADHVGYLDQRFFGSYNNFGTVKATFEWNQMPLFYSDATQTLYSQSSPGVFTLPTGLQTGLQNKTLTLQQAAAGASAFDIQSKRSVANFNLLYNAAPNVDFNVTVKNTLRNGAQPMSVGFGFSGVPEELAAPVDTRTTEFGTSLQYGNDRGYAKLAYDGSFFRNNVATLTWANPMRALDSATAGPANGRLALWPNTDQNTVSASAGLNKLPGRSHVTGMVSYSAMSNNDPLIPYTINSAIPSPTLFRNTADVNAKVTAMNFLFTSRPVNTLWFSARYRQYEFNNQTNPFVVSQAVTYDYSLSTVNMTSEPLGYTRHTFDADTSYSPVSFIGLRAGYTREVIDRSYRFIDTTTEDVGRASIDLTGTSWVTLRGVYEHAKRVGTPTTPAEILALGEQPGLGQYDIANRNRDRVTGIVIVTPVSALSFNASAGRLKDEYPTSYFGLRNGDNNVYTVGFDAVPIDNRVNFGLSYGYERNNALQASRYAGHVASGLPPAFFDPRDDWFDNSADTSRTVNGSIDILKFIPKTDVKLAFDYTKSDSTYTYSLAPVTVLATPQPLPAVTNELTRGIVDVLYHLSAHLGAGLSYVFDKYTVNDFALGPQANGLIPSPPAATPSILMVGYYFLPYTANTFAARVSYFW